MDSLERDASHFKAIIGSLDDAIISISLNCRVTSWSPSAESLYGYNAQEMLGQPLIRLFPTDRADDCVSVIAKVHKANEAKQFETLCVRKDGLVIPILSTIAPIHNSVGEIIGVSVVTRDISESKKNLELLEESIQGLERMAQLYSALMECNDAIVRATTQSDLFKSVCQAAVRGGIKFIWVGLVNKSTGLLEPVAFDGVGAEYLDGLKVSVIPGDAYSKGPTGSSFLENRPIIADDFLSDPRTIPWRERAKPFGWRTAGGLPIRKKGKPIGSLTFYMDEPSALDKRFQELMIEMGNNISFALDKMDADHELQATKAAIERMIHDTMDSISAMVEMRDPYTAGHEHRVSRLSVAIGREIGLDEHDLTGLKLAASVHDLGKIALPVEILSLPRRLTPLEYEFVKIHVDKGFEILNKINSPWPIAEVVRQHHERMDGSGYPRGLKGDEILIEARILAVADVVESMASHRPYRPALGIEAAIAEIEHNRGVLYDAQVVDTCVSLINNGFELNG